MRPGSCALGLAAFLFQEQSVEDRDESMPTDTTAVLLDRPLDVLDVAARSRLTVSLCRDASAGRASHPHAVRVAQAGIVAARERCRSRAATHSRLPPVARFEALARALLLRLSARRRHSSLQNRRRRPRVAITTAAPQSGHRQPERGGRLNRAWIAAVAHLAEQYTRGRPTAFASTATPQILHGLSAREVIVFRSFCAAMLAARPKVFQFARVHGVDNSRSPGRSGGKK